MTKILIIGFGNILMGDDGAGIHLIRKLGQAHLPHGVELLDGGVSSFAALSELRQANYGILIDSMKGGGQPGDIYRMTADELTDQWVQQTWSLHDFTLMDSLRALRRMQEAIPLFVYGIEPLQTELSMLLSCPVALAVDRVTALVMEDLTLILHGR